MNMAGGHELAFASRAILGELLAELVASNILTADAVGSVPDRSIVSLQGLGNIVNVPGGDFNGQRCAIGSRQARRLERALARSPLHLRSFGSAPVSFARPRR